MKGRAWISALRGRLAGLPRTPGRALDASLLLGQEEQAQRATDFALSALRAAISTTAAQRTGLDHLDEELHLLAARSRDLATTLDLARDALERCRLLALNAGLEGARLGEAAGRALLALSDEVRTVAARGLEVFSDHSAALEQQTRAQDRLLSALDLSVRQSGSIADDLTRAEQAQIEAQHALSELGVELQRGSGADPEVMRVAGSAATHLHAVAAALVGLSSHEQRLAALEALRPSLQPLLRLLHEHGNDPRERT